MTESEKRIHIRMINLARRHLSKVERKKHWEEMRADGMTYQAIADVSGVSDQTIINAVSKLLETQPESVIGKDGKKYPPTKKPSIIAKTKQEQKRAVEALEKLPDDALPDKLLDTNRVTRIAREHQAEERAKDMPDEPANIGAATLILGDFRIHGLEVLSESIDLIFTDPPYPEKSLPLWSDLSEFANRVLKPNGMLVAYTGAMYLPEVINRLGERLTYWWAGSIVLNGPHSRVFARNIAQGSKPLLFYVKDGFKPNIWIEDTYHSEGEQKESHDWQQSIGAAMYYIETLTEPGAKVVDPFLGGGTTGVAAIKSGRDFTGIEIDRVAMATAHERIEQEHGS